MCIPLERLKPKERRGSKLRCHLLTHGSPDAVAAKLTALVAPFASVAPKIAGCRKDLKTLMRLLSRRLRACCRRRCGLSSGGGGSWPPEQHADP